MEGIIKQSDLLDNMHHVGDIQAPCRHCCSYQNRHSPRFEIFQSLDIVDIIESCS